MNTFWWLLTFTFFFISISLQLNAQELVASDTSDFAQMDFVESEYNFGDIFQGDKSKHTFAFKNVGNSPLIINNVLTTCGCTAPKWPEHPIPPGESGDIVVVFDSTSKIGRQNKVITIRSNAKSGDYRLRISAMVLPPKME